MRRLLIALALMIGRAFAQDSAPPLQKVDPRYSEEARVAGLEGSVLVTGKIAADGSMQNLHVSGPLGLGLNEQALAAAAQYRFAPDSPGLVTLSIDFALPSKHSQWHLTGVEFKTPAEVSRPTFAAADYPAGSGVGLAAYDEARILAVIGRGASAAVSFDVDERGYPGNFQVVGASMDVWGPEAVMVVHSWRFHPAMKAGMPVSVPCTVSLVWGPEDFTSEAVARQRYLIYPSGSDGRDQPLTDIVSKTEPVYTDAAREAGLEGTAVITAVVDEEGKPVKTEIVGGLGMGLDQSAEEAIKGWRFSPATPELVVEVKFKLSGVVSTVFAMPPAAAGTKR
jgi:TonB family protein